MPIVALFPTKYSHSYSFTSNSPFDQSFFNSTDQQIIHDSIHNDPTNSVPNLQIQYSYYYQIVHHYTIVVNPLFQFPSILGDLSLIWKNEYINVSKCTENQFVPS